jgi:hypothetical protein
MERMDRFRYGRASLVALALFAGCDDGDGAGPSGGDGIVGCPEGVVCGTASESPEALRQRRELQAEVWRLWEQGRSTEEIAAALREAPGVLRAGAAPFTVVFDVEGARRQYIAFDTHLPETDLEWFESTHRGSGQGLVVSKPADDVEDEKAARLYAPFESPSFPSRIPEAAAALRAQRDYDEVDVLGGAIPLPQWARINEAHFVWVSTHGDFSVSEDDFDVQISYLAAGGECGTTAVLRANADRPLAEGGGTWGDQVGRPVGQLVNYGESSTSPFTPEEWQEIEDLGRERDAEELASGASCGTMPVVGGDGVRRYYTMWLLDEIWWRTTFRGGLRDVFFYADACSSNAIPFGPGGGDFTYLGWSESLPIAHSNLVGTQLIDRLIDEGWTVGAALEDLGDLRETTNRAGLTTRLQRVSGTDALRVRETVRFVDPVLEIPLDDGAVLDLIQNDDEGARFELPVLVDGLRSDESAEGYALSLHRIDPDQTLIADLELPADARRASGAFRVALTGQTDRLVAGELVVLEVRLALAEGGQSRHRVEFQVAEPGEDDWSFSLGGETAAGEEVSSIFARAVPSDDGLIWPLSLSPRVGGVGEVPFAELVLRGHPGRSVDCTGPTGSYSAGLIVNTSRYLYLAENATVQIDAFGIDGFSATVSGTAERGDPQNPDAEPVMVPVSGTVEWARTGCPSTERPVDPDFVGSFRDPENTAICIDLYTGSFIRSKEIFDQSCELDDLDCSDDPCPAAGRIARCDYRTQGAQLAFADTVQSFYPGADLTLEDIELGCSVSGGTFLPN